MGGEKNLKAENIDSEVLKVCPTSLQLDKLALQKDLDDFKRRLRLFEYFNSDKDNDKGSTDLEVSRFRNKSTWTPPAGRDSFLDSFLEAVQREVDAFQPPKYVKDNLTLEEREALTNLWTDDNIVIKPEDKGPAFVIQNKTDYIHTAKTDLSNVNFYRKNTVDKTPETAERVNKVVREMLREGDIKEKTAEYLVTNDVRTSRFYTLPKTQKAKDENGHLKIRPVISGNGSPIERLSEFRERQMTPRALASAIQTREVELDRLWRKIRKELRDLESEKYTGEIDSALSEIEAKYKLYKDKWEE
ncbi:hypothetical protein HOLleu_15540 [Holothuria leucospilota]|uniref:Uncharacterized protein n=1 Tax=Holothuria leucospilota TaxID=206669 RepID=A0A9Q1C4U8_HOLLE|nr:hypothetical protein HOLleu_15540 [Holothuria leucospilota]